MYRSTNAPSANVRLLFFVFGSSTSPRQWRCSIRDRALLRVEVLQLQADRLGDSRPGVETRLANQELRIFEAREHGGGLVVVEDAFLAHRPLPADFHALHRIRKGLRQNLPLLRAGENAAHDVPQVDHHVPGRTLVLEPVEDFLRSELPEPLFFPPRQDVVIEPGAVLLAGGRRELHFRIIDVILAPQLRELAEEDGGHFDRLACDHRRLATRRRGVLLGEEYVPLAFRLFLGDGVFAPAWTDRVKLPSGLNRSVRQQLVVPVAEEPIVATAIFPLVNFRMLNPQFQPDTSS